MKSFGVTIQMKSLQQFFHMLILILSFGNLKMEFGIFAIFFFVLLWPPLGVKGRGKEGRKAFCMKT